MCAAGLLGNPLSPNHATGFQSGEGELVLTWRLRNTNGQVVSEARSQLSGAEEVYSWQKDFIVTPRGLLAAVGADENDLILTAYHLDHLSSPRGISDEFGLQYITTYLPFGEQLQAPENQQFGLAGHERDSTYNYYMRGRYYSTLDGRFLSVDPIRDGWNLYSYASNNPVNRFDFDGFEDEEGYTLPFHLAGFGTETVVRYRGEERDAAPVGCRWGPCQRGSRIQRTLRKIDYTETLKLGVLDIEKKMEGGTQEEYYELTARGHLKRTDLRGGDVEWNVKLNFNLSDKLGPLKALLEKLGVQVGGSIGFNGEVDVGLSDPTGHIELKVETDPETRELRVVGKTVAEIFNSGDSTEADQ